MTSLASCILFSTVPYDDQLDRRNNTMCSSFCYCICYVHISTHTEVEGWIGKARYPEEGEGIGKQTNRDTNWDTELGQSLYKDVWLHTSIMHLRF